MLGSEGLSFLQLQPLQAWLRAACAAAVGPVQSQPSAEDWACLREEAFPPSEVNLYRHLRVQEFSDAVHRLPPEEMHGMERGEAGGWGGVGGGVGWGSVAPAATGDAWHAAG